MNKKLHFLWLVLLLLGSTVCVNAQESACKAGEPEPEMTITYDKMIGGRVQLNIVADGAFSIEGIQEIAESGNNFYTLTSPTITIFGKIKELTAIYSSILTIDVTKMPSLQLLDIFGNQIENIDLTNNVNLKQLLLGGSSVKELNLSTCPKLEFLNINNSSIEKLDLSNSGALHTLLARGSKVKNWDLTGANRLEVLDCSFVELESINLEKAPALNQLACVGNNLTSLDLSKSPNLVVLNCNANQLTSLDLTQLPLLEELGCSKNQITELDCSKCPKIFGMIINSNQIGHKKMSQLIEGMPTVEAQPGYVVVIDQKDTNEKNVCTESNVAKANDKNWDVLDYDGGSNFDGPGIPYTGSPDDEVSIDAFEQHEWVAYPTVAEDLVYVDRVAEGTPVRIIDLQGRVVLQETARNNQAVLNVAALDRGVVILSVGDEYTRVVLK